MEHVVRSLACAIGPSAPGVFSTQPIELNELGEERQ